MNSLNSRIIIVGAGGSGKDYLKQKFVDKGYKPSVSYTTRPPRKGEEHGKDYYFIRTDDFYKMVDNDDFFEHQKFRGWCYGTALVEFTKADIFIMTPPAIEILPVNVRKTSLIIYLDIPAEIRAERMESRKDSDSVARRIAADKEMFEGFSDYDIKIDSPEF